MKQIVAGDRVQLITAGTAWEGEEMPSPEFEGMWGTVTRGDEILAHNEKAMSLLVVRWDVSAPGLVARELLRPQYVIAEEAIQA